jgi:5-deoxy-glucuronate isomerase
MSCGRVRKEITSEWTQLIKDELRLLNAGVINLEAGASYTINTHDREYGFVLIYGECEVMVNEVKVGKLGPRVNPFYELPHAFLATKDEKVTFLAMNTVRIGAGSAPAREKVRNILITPNMVGGGLRGVGNWQRDVRFVIWSDNTEGNSLLMGETVTSSGNWSTMPPHRHQYYIPGQEVPYEEAYFFQFSKPQGFALVWQFDNEGDMDQSFSVKSDDVVYMDRGYHPVVCGPGADFYQLTIMAGPYRTSKSKVHDDFRFLLEENNMENPYARQLIMK